MNLRLKGTTAIGLAACLFAVPAFADMKAARAFLDGEIGDLSTLSRADQEAELQFFVDAAKPYAGMSINVVSETIGTHTYESTVLAPTLLKSCKLRCSRAKTSMTPISTTLI